ncbi:unnamed protein product [Caenorhabditis bovis]|uniref:SWI5-dependent HO expression protein 3 n=1 Tax=Caenorhabditis bovis TaxID=2654633 RepID=A0A8S1EAR1_9PELO|nr:unnamed protein product [Caenorhabditis bovis]
MGYSTSQLIQSNNFLEGEIKRLNSQYHADQNTIHGLMFRMNQLNDNIRVLSNQKHMCDQKLSQCDMERKRTLEKLNEYQKAFKDLENEGKSLRTLLDTANKEVAMKKEEIGNYQYQLGIVNDQIKALNERNSGLKTKCEELVAKNRRQHDEIADAQKYVENAKLNVQSMRNELELATNDKKQFLKQYEELKSKSSTWSDEKKRIEWAYSKKEDELRATNFKTNQELEKANERIKYLENRLKNEKSSFQMEMAVESIYRSLEIVKSTYEAQLTRLENEIEAMKASSEENERNQAAASAVVLPEYLRTPSRPYFDGETNGNNCMSNQELEENDLLGSPDIDVPPISDPRQIDALLNGS